MKRAFQTMLCAAVVVLFAVTGWSAEVMTGTAPAYADFLSGHLQLGTRISHFMLLEDTKRDVDAEGDIDGFIGSITGLDEQQDYLPLRIFAAYTVTPYWGFELTWDKIEADGINGWNGNVDGTFELSGPVLTAFGRYPNDSGLTPFGGAGFAFLSGDFDEDAWWANGYQNEDDYNNLGPDPRHGITRDMWLEDAIGLVFYGGADYRIWENVYLDALIRLVLVETEVSFGSFVKGNSRHDEQSEDVPFDYLSFNIGAKYVF